MNKKNSPNIGHNKKSLLNSPVEHIDIKSFDARKIIDGKPPPTLIVLGIIFVFLIMFPISRIPFE